MTSKRFVLWSLGLVVMAGWGVVGSSYYLDLYGQFGDVKGASYRPYRPYDRVSKYLLAHNYIPSNFDALLVGSSIAVNWDTQAIAGCKMYNIALSGGNATEEKILLETVLARGNVRLVAFVVNAYLVQSHGPKTNDFSARQYWGSLGSPRLIGNCLSKLGVEIGVLPNFFNDAGAEDLALRVSPQQDVAALMRLAAQRKLPYHKKGEEFRIDPLGLDDLRTAIKTARAHGARIVLIHPPIYCERFEAIEQEYHEFGRIIEPLFLPFGPVLDFNTGRYDAICTDLANFQDQAHFTQRGAQRIVEAVNAFLRENNEGETRLEAVDADRLVPKL